jgi:MFS family permease
MRSRGFVVAALGTAQTLAWGSSYYLPAILADPIAASAGVPRSWVFAAFSVALLIAAFAGPAVGRVIDRHGGRGILMLSNVVLAAGLIVLAASNGAILLFAAWAVLGVGMALGLYDAGFAALTALYGHNARGPITGITLVARFASTVSRPLSTVLNDAWGGARRCWSGRRSTSSSLYPSIFCCRCRSARRIRPMPPNMRRAGNRTRRCSFWRSCSWRHGL